MRSSGRDDMCFSGSGCNDHGVGSACYVLLYYGLTELAILQTLSGIILGISAICRKGPGPWDRDLVSAEGCSNLLTVYQWPGGPGSWIRPGSNFKVLVGRQ